MKGLLSCLIAVVAVIASASMATAQCGLNGTAQCGAPVVGSLNQQLAQLQAINVPSGAASASASTSVGTQGVVTVPQQQQIVYQQQVQPQYVTAPQPQYIAAAPQPQYITIPQMQATVSLPVVQFGTVQAVTAVAQTPQYVTQPQFIVSQPQFVTAPTASAVTSSATASTALPLVAPAPLAIQSGCANGSCSRSRARSGSGVLASLLPGGNRQTSRSKSSTVVRN